MIPFKVNIPTKFHVGLDSFNHLDDISAQLGGKALIVTTGNDLEKLGIVQKAISSLQEHEISTVVFNEVTPNPKTHEIEKGVAFFSDEKCDFIIAIGGGSAIDAGKNIAMVAANGASIYDFLPGGSLVNLEKRKRISLIAIPTTAGTGSEATKTAVVTNQKTAEKYGIRNDCIYPTHSIIDPKLMVTVPKEATAVTGIDVFFHAMEAYFSNKATPFTDMVSIKSMELVIKYLEKAYTNGNDLQARENMAWASTLGGMALDSAICVGIHGLGQPIGGFIDAVHGKTLCSVYYAYMKHTWRSDILRYADVAKLFGYTNSDYTDVQLAEMSPDILKDFLKKFDLNITLRDLGIEENMIPTIAKSVFNTTKRTLECCKMEIGINDVIKIYTDSL